MRIAGKALHVAVMALTALLLVSCAAESTDTTASGHAETTLLPAELHGMALAESHSGDEASGMIGKLHEKGVAPEHSEVGFYGPAESQTTLYVSRFESSEIALAQLDSMSSRIGGGAAGFGHHTEFVAGGVTVHSVLGHGQAHYFYADGTDLSWLSSPPMMARSTLSMLMGIDAADIPEIGAPPAHGSDAESES